MRTIQNGLNSINQQCKYFIIYGLIINFIIVTDAKAQITPAQIISNAQSFVGYSWVANSNNNWNGTLCGGQNVYSANWVNYSGTNTSMPYSWGGFSSIVQHNNAMSNGKSAGDICSQTGGGCSGNSATLNCTSGLDCSGFISRAWALSMKYNTVGLETISTPYSNISQLQPGDILSKPTSGAHVRLVTANNGSQISVMEASGTDWKCAYHSYSPVQLTSYNPRYYNNLSSSSSVSCNNDDCNDAVTLISNGACANCSVDGAGADGFTTPSCDGFAGTILGAGVFFKFTAVNSSQTISVSPTSSLDAVVVVYTGGCFNLQEYDCEDSGGGMGANEVLNLTGLSIGTQYTVRVYDYGSVPPPIGSGGFSICLTHTPCNFTLSPNTQSISSSSFSGTFNVNSSNPSCSWSASSNCSWLTTSSSGVGNGVVNFNVSANTNSSQRTCTIDVNGEIFTLTQDGLTPCIYNISPTFQNVTNAASLGSFSINTDPSCAWSAVSNCNWLVTNTTGTGNGTIYYSCTANTGPQRTCTINVGGQIFTVTQNGSTACVYTISPNSNNYNSQSGSGSFAINVVPSTCIWTASESCSWVNLTNSTGTGNGTITFNYDPNPNMNSRTCNINVGGQVFSIIQSGISTTGLIADFYASQTSGCAPLSVDFFDNSTGNPQSYVWEFLGNGVNPSASTSQNPTSITYSLPGSYTVKLTVYDNVTNSFEVKTNYITVNCVTGLDEDFEKNGIIISPNPSNGIINITLKNPYAHEVKILDIVGKIVYEGIINEEENSINLIHQSSGAYFVVIRADSRTLYKKIILN